MALIHIFGILRVHRALLCVWFPRYMGVLTLDEVKMRRDWSLRCADELRTERAQGEGAEGRKKMERSKSVLSVYQGFSDMLLG